MAGVSIAKSTSASATTSAIPIVALDYPDAESALRLVALLGDSCRFYKIGSELFTAAGPDVVKRTRDEGCDVFLDLKLHDIPNTVAGAMRRIAAMGVRLATVHAFGGRTMIEAAVEAAGPNCGILAVTILTSLDRAALSEITGDPNADPADSVLRLAELARSAGARGVVCSGEEAPLVRSQFGGRLEILVPGIRLPGDSAGDQARIVTPESALRAGANYIVLGRSITSATDPRSIMETVRSRLISHDLA